MAQKENDYSTPAPETSYEEKMRHSAAHILAAAVLRIYPEAKLGIGPAVENGFYYDFEFPKQITPEDLPAIEREMKSIVEEELPITQTFIPREQAMDMLHMRGQIYKTELLQEIPDETISFFKTGEEFSDLCRGPHVKHTGKIGAFKLTHIAGAYWRGDETRPQLQRIYGLAFKTQKKLDDFVEMQEEMKLRDHRKLGKELELFTVSDMIGAGLPIWLPKGATIRKVIQDFLYKEQESAGYQHIIAPHIGKVDLYKTSGHWDYYKDNMYSPIKIDEEEFILKPMNCPHHIQAYDVKKRSYRELPLRLAEFGTVYRYEQSGELSGMSRVRGFTIDDAHIFCEPEQVQSEFVASIKLALKVLRALGLSDYRLEISLRDPENKKKYSGNDDLWDRAEKAIKDSVKVLGLVAREMEGEAAFYGPKLDFKFKDVFGREHQLSTVQLDFNLPEKFKLTYINKKGIEERPVMVHRALLGSFERFFSIFIEHYGGAFPLWLAPVQAEIIPISENFMVYAKKVKKMLEEAGIRSEIDDRDETMQSKIRDAQLQKVPYMLVIGEKEEKNEGVAVRPRAGQDQGMVKLAEFIRDASKKIEDKVIF
ncbi:threonine--tRNA ligase [Candidatus Dojkabacteria bacterium]|nr:threonine--tRNA ligase [Candidatus Dojkabacteria bacterium]